MRFITEPRHNQKLRKKWHQDALDLMQLDSFDIGKENCIKAIYSMYGYLEKVPGSQESLEESVYFCRLSEAYSYFLADALDWKIGYLILREKKPEEDAFGVYSPQYKYAVHSYYLPKISHREKKNYFVDLYEKIISGNLPSSQPEKFFDLVNHLYLKIFPTFFHPVKEDKQQEMDRMLRVSLALIDATCDSAGNLVNITPLIALQRLEKIILEDRTAYQKTPKKVYLASLTLLFGQCINWLCGFKWGMAWFDEMCDVLVIYRPDKKYYLKPSKIIRAALKSNSPTCNLLSYYERIRDGILPEIEWEESPEEII